MRPISKPIIELLKLYRLNLKKLPNELLQPLECGTDARKGDFEYTLVSDETLYNNREIKALSITQVMGSTVLAERISLLEYVSMLYTDKHEYGKRSLEKLECSIVDNINDINKTADTKPIRLIRVKDKYYVNNDGNHKAFYLLLMYYIEQELAKENNNLLRELEDRYRIKMEVRQISDYNIINKVFYALIKSGNRNIKIDFATNPNGIGTLYIKDSKMEIQSEEQFVSYFYQYFNNLERESMEFQTLVYFLIRVGYFNEDIVKTVHNIQDEDIIDFRTAKKAKKVL